MLTYTFSANKEIPLYRQLYSLIRTDILRHKLNPGDRLPSKRTFAKNLGISVITIENAYSQLDAEGYIYSIPQKGFFVSDISTDFAKYTTTETSNIFVENTSSINNPVIADFTGNKISSSCFPFSIWAKLTRNVINNRKDELVTNSPCGGIYELRTAIKKHLKAFRNIDVSEEQIIVGAGTEYLYGLLLQLLGLEKKYGVEDPCYEKIHSIYNCHGVNCKYISMDEYGVNPESLTNEKIDIIHISPSHHYPTGLIMPISRRLELLKWANGSDKRYIIEDDYDSEFRMTGHTIPAMQNIDINEKVIYINTFTKTLASTVRISYMVLPPHLVHEFKNKMSFYSCTVSNFEQYTLANFIDGGYFEKHLNRMRNYYRKKRDYILKCIADSPLNSLASVMEENSGLHFILKLEMNLSDKDFCKKTECRGIRISALSSFYHNKSSNVGKQFVINYSSLTDEAITKAVDIIYEIIKTC